MEELPACATTVTFRAAIPAEEADVRDVMLYAFDSEGQFLESRHTVAGRPETFFYAKPQKLTFVGWGNTEGGAVAVTQFTQGDNISTGYVSLVSKSVSEPSPNHIDVPPSDLFFSSDTAVVSGVGGHVVLYGNRMVAGMNITVRRLKAYTGIYDNNYTIVVGTTDNRLDFSGRYSGADAEYMPSGAFNATQEYYVPTFNLFPSLDATLSVRIYHGNDLVYETTQNHDGTLIKAVADQTLNVLIDFSNTRIQVSVLMSGWNEVIEWEKIIR